MLKILLKNGLTLWMKWVYGMYQIRKKFPNASVGYMGKLLGNSSLGYKSFIDNYAIMEHTTIGDYSYVGTESRLNHTKVGKYSSIGPGVYAGLGIHPTSNFVTTCNKFYTSDKTATDLPYFEDYTETIIGNDVWIGARAILIDGIRIGDGAVIGAGAVVTKDIPPYAIAVGVPAKIIKYRFEEEEIRFLQKFKWWDKQETWVNQNKMLFSDVKLLMKTYANNPSHTETVYVK